jgi:hypothetical protein
MSRRSRLVALALFLLAIAPATARAQLVVLDPGNLVQAVLISERTWRQYQTLYDQYQLIRRMSRGLSSLDAYRIPAIATTRHDSSRLPYGRPWLDGLNSGDPGGQGYWATARRLERPAGAALQQLPAAAREAIERMYSTIEISDSVAMMGGHQAALVRGYSARLQQAVGALERDVVSSDDNYHQLTAILDKISAGELLGRRQDMAANQLLTHTLEQLLTGNKRRRDTEVALMNMRLRTIRDGRRVNSTLAAGAAQDLTTWRQP